MLHNAICLVTAWRKLRLGFIITPMQLVNPNQVQILMLVVHLFQVLPTYIPRAKVCTKKKNHTFIITLVLFCHVVTLNIYNANNIFINKCLLSRRHYPKTYNFILCVQQHYYYLFHCYRSNLAVHCPKL